ncbi:MAG TPA: hypothetical protein VGO47_01985 [Chlamydiales bacterium]|jgi:hypothetical protein|nr:hypothetical protein [Chlamydiales bacterium]
MSYNNLNTPAWSLSTRPLPWDTAVRDDHLKPWYVHVEIAQLGRPYRKFRPDVILEPNSSIGLQNEPELTTLPGPLLVGPPSSEGADVCPPWHAQNIDNTSVDG